MDYPVYLHDGGRLENATITVTQDVAVFVAGKNVTIKDCNIVKS